MSSFLNRLIIDIQKVKHTIINGVHKATIPKNMIDLPMMRKYLEAEHWYVYLVRENGMPYLEVRLEEKE